MELNITLFLGDLCPQFWRNFDLKVTASEFGCCESTCTASRAFRVGVQKSLTLNDRREISSLWALCS